MNPEKQSPKGTNKSYINKKYNFKMPPDTLPDREISQTIETEVVVIGAGQSVEDVVAGWERNVQYGKFLKADSIEELAGKLGLDAKTIKTTVDRYNGFCKTGTDEDFFKRKDLLIPIDTPPFYGQSKNSPDLLFVTGGLCTNIDMQVLDTNGKVIPGLYAVGTIVGDMFANYFTFMVPGINLGATCVTFDYLAGKKIAGS